MSVTEAKTINGVEAVGCIVVPTAEMGKVDESACSERNCVPSHSHVEVLIPRVTVMGQGLVRMW